MSLDPRPPQDVYKTTTPARSEIVGVALWVYACAIIRKPEAEHPLDENPGYATVSHR